MQKLRCLYFEDDDDDFETYKLIFERALEPVATLDIARAKTTKEAHNTLDVQGKDLHLFFADLLVGETSVEGLHLVEYVAKRFPHILIIGVSKADGSLPGTSKTFKRLAGPDSVFFDKKALKSSNYTFQMVSDEIIEVAPRKGYLRSVEAHSVGASSANDLVAPSPWHGVDVAAKYIFLDIVGFTRSRPVEAQSDVIERLNHFVSETIKEKNIGTDNRIFLPTGDGICIVLLSIEHPVDISIQIAVKILERITIYNASTVDESRRFQVRIGVESGEDVLVADINGQQNIAGDGINMAARIMDLADGSQILSGQRVYNSLKSREGYPEKFRHYPATVKHGTQLSVYQFIGKGYAGLNVDPPDRLIQTSNAHTQPSIIHGSLVELFGIIEKRTGQIDRLRIYANASASIQPIFANSRLRAGTCEIILRKPDTNEPDRAAFLQLIGRMLKQWQGLKKGGRISELECRRSDKVATEWQIIFDNAFIICGLNVPDRSDWLGIAEMEPLLVDDSTPQGKLFIDKYVERFDRFFKLAEASPVGE